MLIYSISNHEYDIYMSFSLALISRERNSNGWLNGIAVTPTNDYTMTVSSNEWLVYQLVGYS